ncbi:MAG: superinfection immunity protein [Terriglobales bacterium]
MSGQALALIVLCFFVYFLPAMLAYQWRHRNRGAILVLNFILGWTVLGWIAALVWCSTSNVENKVTPPHDSELPRRA